MSADIERGRAIVEKLIQSESAAQMQGKSFHRIWRACYESARDMAPIESAIAFADQMAKEIMEQGGPESLGRCDFYLRRAL